MSSGTEHRPLQLSAKGVNSLLDVGGIVILYKPGDAACCGIHESGKREQVSNELAELTATTGVPVGVVNQDRNKPFLPSALADAPPGTIFVTPPGGHDPVEYTGEDRSAPAIWNFYQQQVADQGGYLVPGAASAVEMQRHASVRRAGAVQALSERAREELDRARTQRLPAEHVAPIATAEELRRFLGTENGIVLLHQAGQAATAEEIARGATARNLRVSTLPIGAEVEEQLAAALLQTNG